MLCQDMSKLEETEKYLFFRRQNMKEDWYNSVHYYMIVVCVLFLTISARGRGPQLMSAHIPQWNHIALRSHHFLIYVLYIPYIKLASPGVSEHPTRLQLPDTLSLKLKSFSNWWAKLVQKLQSIYHNFMKRPFQLIMTKTHVKKHLAKSNTLHTIF